MVTDKDAIEEYKEAHKNMVAAIISMGRVLVKGKNSTGLIQKFLTDIVMGEQNIITCAAAFLLASDSVPLEMKKTIERRLDYLGSSYVEETDRKMGR